MVVHELLPSVTGQAHDLAHSLTQDVNGIAGSIERHAFALGEVFEFMKSILDDLIDLLTVFAWISRLAGALANK